MDRQSQKYRLFLARFWWISPSDQNNAKQEPRALKPISIAYSKALTSVFWLLKQVSYFVWTGRIRKNTHIFARFSMDFHPTYSNKNDQKNPNQEPRALKPINIAYLKALTSVFWLLNRVFYRSAESGHYFLPGFDWFSSHFFKQKWPESPQRGAPCLKADQHSLFEGPDISLLAAEASLFLYE